MKTLVFAGSTRQQSFNRRLAAVAALTARDQGAEVTLLELADFELPLYNGDLEAQGTPDNVRRLKEIFHAHPAWLICSPEYNGSYTGLLKNTLDWLSRPIAGDADWAVGGKPFENKVVGLLAASNGALGGLRSLGNLAPLMRQLQCWVAPKQFALARAAEAFDDKGLLRDATQQASVAGVVAQTLHAARKLNG
jgi:chromate reductase, NAD(P)H dehydrogenase (quinone)